MTTDSLYKGGEEETFGSSGKGSRRRLLPLPPPRKSWLKVLANLPAAKRDDLLQMLGITDLKTLLSDWQFVGRREQQPPRSSWLLWLILAGRGFGKTAAASHWLVDQHRYPPAFGADAPTGIIAATTEDLKRYCLRGPSGILSIAPPDFYPSHEPYNSRLVWPDGSETLLFTSEKPERIRGPNLRAAWADELASWKNLDECWDNLEFSLRASADPRVVASTTPKPRALLKKLVKDKDTTVTGGSTFDNAENLAPTFIARMREKYEGTTKGRQELFAEILSEAKGALWTREVFEKYRLWPEEIGPEQMSRIVIALDPSANGSSKGADFGTAGIVAAGVLNRQGYVLGDDSEKCSPNEWAKKAVRLFDRLQADCIVAEKNHGGEMVETVIRSVAKDMCQNGERELPYVPIRTVWASRGKYVRAEPVSMLYEQGRIHHVGNFDELEEECVTWVPNEGKPSPNRLDALVWAFHELLASKRAPLPAGTETGVYGLLACAGPDDSQMIPMESCPSPFSDLTLDEGLLH